MYYYGPDKRKAYVEKCVEVRERLRTPAAAKAWATRLDPATRLNDPSARPATTVDAAKATVKEFCTKTFVLVVRTAAERCVRSCVTDKVGPDGDGGR